MGKKIPCHNSQTGPRRFSGPRVRPWEVIAAPVGAPKISQTCHGPGSVLSSSTSSLARYSTNERKDIEHSSCWPEGTASQDGPVQLQQGAYIQFYKRLHDSFIHSTYVSKVGQVGDSAASDVRAGCAPLSPASGWGGFLRAIETEACRAGLQGHVRSSVRAGKRKREAARACRVSVSQGDMIPD